MKLIAYCWQLNDAPLNANANISNVSINIYVRVELCKRKKVSERKNKVAR